MNGAAERDTEVGERPSGYVSTQADVAAAAHALATQGVLIFPCHPTTKRPLVATGFKAATSDGPTVDTWWRRWPKAMIGMPMGEANGLFTLDIDRDAATGLDGFSALASLEEMHGPLPPTRTQCTPRGGEHRLFRWPGVKVRNSASKLGAGIDVRGDGGYIIVPPSVNGEGLPYAWTRMEKVAVAPEWLLRQVVGAADASRGAPGAPRPGPRCEGRERYAAAALADECRAVAQATKGERNTILNRAAFSLGQLIGAGALQRGTVEVSLVNAATRCGLVADDGQNVTRATIESGLAAGIQVPREIPGGRESRAVGQRGNAHVAGESTDFDLTEDGIALAFAKKHGNDLRFCHHTATWYVWTGTRWRAEPTRLAFDWARQICRNLNVEAKAKLASAATAAAVERFAQADRQFAVTSEVWDPNPFLLGTPGGVVDLRDGILRPAERADCISRQTAIAPDEKLGCPLWTRFLNDVTCGDSGLQRFLRQVAGYCLTGDVREHALFFVYGPGGNGKSVFLNTLAGALGDYATTAAMDSFSASATNQHPTDLAMLQGARMVSVSETDEGKAWAESRIKQLTGGDTIRARFMRQDFFEYRPQFKLVIVGNHKPVLRNVDDAAQRRFNIIPFVHKPQTPDRQLEDKLKAEWPAILAWAIGGALDWQKNGLVRPAVVADATSEYFSEQDSVRQWVKECCETGSRAYSDTTAELFASWSAYAQVNGEMPRTTKWLSQALHRQEYVSVAETPGRRKTRGFLGIRVRAVETSSQRQDQVVGP